MSFRGLIVIECDDLSHPESFVSPACHITDRLPLTCVAGHGIESGFFPAFPKDCVGHLYAPGRHVRKRFSELSGVFLEDVSLTHRVTQVTHKHCPVMHMFSTFCDFVTDQNRQSSDDAAWIAMPANPPTTVPLMRMNCRSRPTCSSMRSAVSLPSHRLTVAEMMVATSLP